MSHIFPAILPVTCHTDFVGPGSIFVVIKGFSTNGWRYILQAIERGATTLVVEDTHHFNTQTWGAIYANNVVIHRVSNARRALAQLSAKAAKYPAKKLKIIGVTGTKGKTTTAHLLFHILQTAGIASALISSVGNYISQKKFAPSLTTPQPDYLHQFLNLCVADGVVWVVMEVACHAVTLHRIDGIQFDAVIITNIAREHLELYKSMEAYAQAKLALLTYRKKNAPAWLNYDDKRLAQVTGDSIGYFSFKKEAAISAQCTHTVPTIQKCMVSMDGHTLTISSDRLMGEYNVYNIVAALAGAHTVGIAKAKMEQAIQTFTGVAGRGEVYTLPNGARAIIDYAHNPFSYHALFSTLRLQTNHLIIVFGAGGDRDQGRRALMGEIVAQYADYIVITTDNPRSENPASIVEKIIAGIAHDKRNRVVIEPDRHKAIIAAYRRSKEGTIIALVGKGPDEYQIIGSRKVPFSERTILQSLG